jgi:peptidoglycan/xylan/chitin deacetylase (PgdA/CDA1 family)
MKRWALALLVCAACSKKPEAPILNYHSVGAGDVSESAFNAQLDWLASAGFHTISLADLAEGAPKNAVVLTFDDGTDDALTRVLPALRKRGMRGTFFIVTGFVGKPGYLSWDGVRALSAAGMEIGSHSVDHARLPELPVEEARKELAESKRELEKQLGHPVVLLAYPFNSVRGDVQRLAAEVGYRIAVAGPVHGSADLLDLARIPVKREMTLQEFQAALPAH